jgi:hypothetical protein
MQHLEATVYPQEVLEGAYEENNRRTFLQMAKNAEKTEIPELSKTLRYLYSFVSETSQDSPSKNQFETFEHSQYAADIPLSHGPYVRFAFNVVSALGNTDPIGQTVYSKMGKSMLEDPESQSMMTLLGIENLDKAPSDQNNVTFISQSTNLGNTDARIGVSPVDFSIKLKTQQPLKSNF